MIRVSGAGLVLTALVSGTSAQAQSMVAGPWSGFSAGLNGGASAPAPEHSAGAASTHGGNGGLTGGGQIGYNITIDRLMIGVEADFQSASTKASQTSSRTVVIPGTPAVQGTSGSPATCTLFFDNQPIGTITPRDPTECLFRAGLIPVSPNGVPGGFRENPAVPAVLGTPGTPATATSYVQHVASWIGWFGTTRARLGFTPFPELLVYATGGLAYGETRSSYSLSTQMPAGVGLTVPLFAQNRDQVRFGYSVGGGLEYALAQNWTIRGEYLWVDLGGITVRPRSDLAPGASLPSVRVGFDTHVARFGVNYHF